MSYILNVIISIISIYIIFIYVKKYINMVNPPPVVKKVQNDEIYRYYKYDMKGSEPMTFKREKITEEKDIEIFDSYKFINPFGKVPITNYSVDPATNETKLRSKVWSIDRERNAFLTGLGGRGVEWEIPEFYALVWNNNVIIFALYLARKENENSETVWINKILRIFAPKSLTGHDDEITEMIKNSLIGNYFGPNVPIFKFEFRYKPQYILEGDDFKNPEIMGRLYKK